MGKEFTNALRGLAILLIVIQHVGGGKFFINQLTPCGGTGVALFLLLSGYGLSESWKKKGCAGFWTGKLLRVYIPYVLWISFLRLLGHRPFTEADFFYDVTLLDTSYWYVGYVFWWYVTFYVCSRWLGRYGFAAMVIAGIAFFVLDCKTIRCEQCMSFVFGVLLSHNKEILHKLSRRKCFMISFGMLVVGISALAIKQLPLLREIQGSIYWNTTELLIKLPLAISVLFGALPFSKKMENCHFLALLGMMSLELYLVHMHYLYMIESVVDVVAFAFVSLGMAYSFWHFNTYIGQIGRKIVCW